MTNTIMKQSSRISKLSKKNILDIDFGKKLTSSADQTSLTKLQFICDKAFEASTGEKVLSQEEKFSRLGFTTPSEPLKDFQNCPPGILPLDFMVYFAEKTAMRQTLYDFVSEKLAKNADYLFPFAKASIAMIKLLCRILNIGEKKQVDENFQILFLIFTLNNDGINEFFAKCLCLFKRLWSEMKAQSLDFDRALLALNDSLHIIASEANKIKQSEQTATNQVYKRCICDFNANIEMWKYDNLKIPRRYDKSSREPIKQVERLLTEEVQQMLKPKKMSVLIKGETFDKVTAKDRKPTKQKQFWKLSSDHRSFTFSEFDNNGDPVNTDQIDLTQIRSIRKEEIKNRQYFALNIVLDTSSVPFLVGSQHEETIDFWLDATEMLMDNSRAAGTNITCFVNCLIDTQLLDLQTLGFDGEIPHEVPVVPEMPKDFDFVFVKA